MVVGPQPAIGLRDAPVVAWDLDAPDTAGPAHSLDAGCDLDQSDCIRRLCQKISEAIDEPQLREPVDADSSGELDSTIKQPVREG